MPRPANTNERRSQIIEGLLAVMAERGYDGASVNAIAKAAQLAPGLVHYHFGNKEEILVAAVRRLASDHAARLSALDELAESPVAARLTRFIDLHLGVGEYADPRALACWVMVFGEAIRKPAVQIEISAALRDVTAVLVGIVEDGVAQGDLDDLDSESSAAAIVAGIQGYFVVAAAAPDVVPAGSAAAAMRRMVGGLLGVELP